MRYSAEQKVAALNSISNIGVGKTSETMGISIQTLYKWRAEQTTHSDESVKQPSHEQRMSRENAIESVRDILSDNDLLEKIAQLESDNIQLRATIVKLKRVINTLMD